MSLITHVSLVTHSDIAAFAADKVNLSRQRAKTYRDQVNNLRAKLDKHIQDHPDVGLVRMLLSGSLAKGTALRTLNDIDVAVYVKAIDAPVDEAALLDWVAGRLRLAYPQMAPEQISPGNHAVRISFRGTGLDVDVVPVHYEGDPQDRGYLYARDTGERILTSIPLHIQFVRTRKQRQPDHFAQVVRLVKWWVRHCKSENANFRLKSFLAEMIVACVSDSGVDLSDYPRALEAVFEYLVKSQLKQRISFTDYYKSSALPKPTAGVAIEVFDPVNENNNVTQDYSEADRAMIVSKAEDALDALAEARFATTKGRAIECWQEVLSTSFKA
jgi:tRNA nucleotidyltransferase (CCA-adding enzyme)